MFYVLTRRVAKFPTGANATFEPKSANRTLVTVSGPFSSIVRAERAAVASLATHTCIEARVISLEDMQREKDSCSRSGRSSLFDDYAVDRRVREILASAPATV